VLVYGLSTLGYMFLAMLVIAPLVLVVPPAAQLVIAMIAVVPLMAIYMISDYVSYRRVFHRSERLQAMTK
jgi:hypothetical protein